MPIGDVFGGQTLRAAPLCPCERIRINREGKEGAVPFSFAVVPTADERLPSALIRGAATR
eukprot:1177357-Prorocentrum_minimum.AAC.1